jgi:general secretion pathway protein K
MTSRNRGAALLAAMLTVALVATFSAAALWQQWRSVEVETAERARVQSAWILTGALDWARLVLREDARSGGADHLGEPWAVPLEEARLSSFLAAERNVSSENGPEVLDAFLSGQITDLQSRLNVTNLINAGQPSDPDVRAFARLFELLGLPPAQLDRLIENLRFALDTSGANHSSPMAPLLPQQEQQLVWLGIPANTVAVLRPYVTVLPLRDTAVNLNTAGAEVIYAALDGLSMADAQRLVAARQRSHFRNLADAKNAIGSIQPNFGERVGGTGASAVPLAGIGSRFFEVRSRLRLDQLTVEERSVVQRDGLDVRILRRQRGVPQPDAPPEMPQR